MDYNELAKKLHKKYKGKLAVTSKVPITNREDLATFYTPGVAEPCREIAKDPTAAYDYTWKSNSVAVVSDGSAVLWLGDIGGLAGLPVMEGKAILMKEFADIDAVPIVLDTQDPDEIIQTVHHIAPTFGAINLEDIGAPNCFYIEQELNKQLPIPVFHDDQHGTAIVVLAGLLNALKLVEKNMQNIEVVISGAWAAGLAIAKLLHAYGAKNIILVDSQGAIYHDREKLNIYKQAVSELNINHEKGSVHKVIQGADIFIGVSKPNVLTKVDIEHMANNPIVFALSNPDPEISYDKATEGWAAIYASWRSDLPNQVNNLLAFPGILRWALDARITDITSTHKLAAAKSLAAYVKQPTREQLLPDPLDKEVVQVVAQAIKKT